jgi:hypothetical protein
MPVRTVDGQPRAWRWWPTAEERAPYEALWLEEARAPLLEAGRALMRSADVEHVRAGAFVIESLGTPEDGALVIETLETTMRGLRDREQPDANIIDNPGAADALVAALAGLRERGYRAPRTGGVGVVMAQFLEWAEPGAQRRTGWESALEAFITQQPHLLRQAALRALPTPTAGERWERVLLAALDDRDLGVLNDACEIAGRSGNMTFAVPLANVIRTEDHWLVVSTASEALRQLGAHALAVDAWIERLSDEKLHTRALSFLADKLEHPPSVGGGGNAASARDARIALREKWRAFFADPARIALVQAGQPVPVTEDEARDLFSGIFAFTLEGNRRWPSDSNPPPAIP